MMNVNTKIKELIVNTLKEEREICLDRAKGYSHFISSHVLRKIVAVNPCVLNGINYFISTHIHMN
ncbi:hypothetical protein AT268_30550 [Bacillus cereus]|uniref:Uncharacterized protein n=1 Tax=Bacillus cereus TaxID=1396 RepID=A0A9X0MKI4_BACCE|nr:hypothetical protein AT268_30550 [Bacillus cereus]PEZ75440.1 hypothetical protein CN410_13075 [Bacillus anthracis]PFA29831.1 hypothetical protein CN384_05730 [Bacillus thuringiensis]PGW06764.1 hypothetical protein COD97_27415 [Bacillus cereus]